MIADANAITKSKIDFFWQQSCQPLDPLTPQSTSGPAKSGAKRDSHNQPQEAAPCRCHDWAPSLIPAQSIFNCQHCSSIFGNENWG